MTELAPPSRRERRIGIYETTELLFEDALAQTWLARRSGADPSRPWVELTVVSPDLTRSEAFRKELMEQSRRASQVENDHFLRPTYSFQAAGALHWVTQHHQGKRLSTLIRERAAHGALLPLEVLVRVFADVTEALTALHHQAPPLVHGDVSPSNVLVTPEGSALLLFSGLAPLIPAGRKNDRVSYKAPEQLGLEGKHGPTADVYGCAVTLAFALTGRQPFSGETEGETVELVLRDGAEDLLDALPASVPPRFVHLLGRALSRNPADRHADARAFRHELLAAGVAAASPRELAAVVDQPATEPLVTNDDQTRVAGALPRAILPPPRLPPPPPKRPPMTFQPKHVEPSPLNRSNASAPSAEDDAQTLLYLREDTQPEPPPSDDATERNALPPVHDRSDLLFICMGAAVAALIGIALWLNHIQTKKPTEHAAAPATASAAPEHDHAAHAGHTSAPGSAAAPAPAEAPESCGADLAKDPRNCGACGNDCGGGKCNEGLCSPVVVASNRARPSGIALDGTHIYWTNSATSGSVMKVALAGGKPMTVAASQASPDGIAVDGKSLYWTSSSGSVTSAPVEGGKTTPVASKQDQPTAIAAQNGAVYWVNQTGSGSVMKAKAGDAPKAIATGLNMPCGVAVDDQNVYYTSYGSGTLSRVGLDGGKPALMASAQSFPCNVAVHGDSVFWVNTGKPSAVMKLSLAGGEAKALASDIAAPSGVATDGKHVYWTTTDKGGAVLRVSVAGGKPETLAKGVGNPAAIAVAQGVLVFADYSGGDVYKIKLGAPAPAPAAHDHSAHAAAAPAEPSPAPPPSASATPAQSAAPPPAPAACAAPAASAAPSPAPAAGGAFDVEWKIASKGNLMAFDQTTYTVKTGQRVKVVFQNVSTLKVMSHNWVLVKPGSEAKVAELGLAAGESASYVPPSNENVLASTKLAGPGETVEVTFVAPAPGTYPFICTMPGHYMVMKGTLTVTP